MHKFKKSVLCIFIILFAFTGYSFASNYILVECYSSDNLDRIILNINGDSKKASYSLQTNYNEWITLIKAKDLKLDLSDPKKQTILIEDIENSTSMTIGIKEKDKDIKIIFKTAVNKKIVFGSCLEL